MSAYSCPVLLVTISDGTCCIPKLGVLFAVEMSTISSPLPPRVMTSSLCCRTCYSRSTMWWWWTRLTRGQCSPTFSLDSSQEYCLSEKRSDLTFCMQHLMQLLLWALRVLHSNIIPYYYSNIIPYNIPIFYSTSPLCPCRMADH